MLVELTDQEYRRLLGTISRREEECSEVTGLLRPEQATRRESLKE
jgi:hypothetical protein